MASGRPERLTRPFVPSSAPAPDPPRVVVAEFPVYGPPATRSPTLSLGASASATTRELLSSTLLGTYGVLRSDPDQRVVLHTRHPPLRFRLPPVPSDLLAGRDTYVPPHPNLGTFADFLAVATQTELQVDLSQFAFVSFRNNFNKILNTPWEDRDPWAIDVRRVGPVIFLGVRDIDHTVNDPVYMGRKFEALCTFPDVGGGASVDGGLPGADHFEEGPVDPGREQFCGIYEVRLGGLRCLLGAELDCYQGDPHETLQASRFVELKTCPELTTPRHHTNYRTWRLRKQWIQSALVGVESIFTGFRRDRCLVSTQMAATHDLPHQALGWTPAAIVSSAVQLLRILQSHVGPDHDYLLQFTPREGAKAGKITLLRGPRQPLASGFLEPAFLQLSPPSSR